MSAIPLFAYGTLQDSDVLRALTGRVPTGVPCIASRWRVAGLPGLSYPGLVPDSSRNASGLLFTDLRASELVLLDAFENPAYALSRIQLRIAGSTFTAWSYTWTREYEDSDWNLVGWQPDKPAYLANVELWRSTYFPPPVSRTRWGSIGMLPALS